MVGVFFDRFGKDIPIRPVDEEHSETRVEVAVSPQFFAWVIGLGNEVKLTGPENVVDEMKQFTKDFLQRYD